TYLHDSLPIYVDKYYVTPKLYVEDMLAQGFNVYLEIKVKGALQAKESFPDGVFIFLTPPSLEELKTRIVGRGTETTDLVQDRLHEAQKEIKMIEEYNYKVVNDNKDRAVQKI